MLHKSLPMTDMHPILAWSVADLTARAALSLTSADNGKVCKVASPLAHYILADYSVPTWVQLDYSASSFGYEDVTAANYTLVAGDAGKLKSFTNAIASTVIVPANASVAFAVGTRIWCAQLGAGRTFFQGAGGVTIYSPTGWKTTKQLYSTVLLTKIATDVWLMSDEVGESGATTAGGDQYWDSVVLALRGEGANNSTTIIDDSNSAKAGTVSGDAKISTAQFKYGSSSLVFDGTGDYITFSASADFGFGTGDFTLELYVRASAFPGAGVYWPILDFRPAGGVVPGGIFFNSTGNIDYFNGSVDTVSSNAIALNTWAHIAINRTSGTTKIFIDGVQGASFSDSSNWATTNICAIGKHQAASTYFNGYLDNIRITKGVGRYPAAFTPPASTFDIYRTPDYDSSWASVVLGLHGEGASIIDSSSSGKTVTANGNAQLSSAQYKYGASSILFDGTGDYLSLASHADWDFGSGDFTVEFFIRFTSLTNTQGLFSHYQSGAAPKGLVLRWLNTNNLRVIHHDDTSSDCAWTPVVNTWYHVAMCRISSTIRVFVDGIQVGSNITPVAGNYNAASTTLQIGRTHTLTDDFSGYLDEYRITKGVGRYSKAFTPPTRAFPEVAS